MAAAVGAHAAVAPLTRSGLGMQRNARGRRNGVCAALPVVELAAQALDQGGLAVMESDGMTGLQFAVASGGAIAALAAVLSVQLDIRQGHAQTVEKVLRFLNDRPLDGVTVCDAGCGTGSLSIPLALQGAHVYASDISSSMVDEAARRAEAALSSNTNGHQTLAPKFEARDLESITGKYDTVACLDVLIHYPQDKAGAMVQHLASLAENRLILSFAPYTLYYAILKRIGELFPGPSKATRAYLHAEADVEAALKDAGWVVKRREMTGTKFYFSRLLEAVPAAQAQ
jgi:magnesium-protoporphyrin O-methyltransferase